MAILVTCEACKQTLRVRNEYLDKKAWCPYCRAPITLTGEHVSNHEVFISYSNKDKNVADAICATLEALPLRCWIAPRDVTAGHSWGSSIIEAIEEAKVMVLVYSGNSNLSSQVIREVERAVAKGLVLVPFRIEATMMSKDMEYFLSASHWVDALTPPLEQHLTELGEMVRTVLFRKEKEQTATAAKKTLQPTALIVPASTSPASQHKNKNRIRIAGVAALAAILGMVGWWVERRQTKPGPSAIGERDTNILGLQDKAIISATDTNINEWFVVLRAKNGYYASPGVPQAAIEALKNAQMRMAKINSFAFTPTGEWVLLDDKGYEVSSDKVPGYGHGARDASDKCLAIAPSGAFILLNARNGYWGGNSVAWSKVHELSGGGHEIRSVSFGPNNWFVVLYDKTHVSYARNTPADLKEVLDNAVSNNIVVQCVAFSGSTWFCLSADDWWASNTNLAAARVIDQWYRSGLRPRWIAFVPREMSQQERLIKARNDSAPGVRKQIGQ
jgi:hypothetical protein